MERRQKKIVLAQNNFALMVKNLLSTDIFEFLRVGHLTSQQKAQLLATMLDTIQSRVVGRVLDIFSTDKERATLERALEKKDTDTINSLLSCRGLPGIEELIAEEIVLYKLEVMSLFQGVE